MNNKEKNKVIAQAWIDYDENIVKVDNAAIKKLKVKLLNENVLSPNELNVLATKNVKESIKYLISLNSINYQFWTIENNEFIRYTHNDMVGALAMSKGFEVFYETLKEYKFNTGHISKELMYECFGNIPEVEERIMILKEVFDKNNFERAYKIIEDDIKNKVLNVETAEKIAKVLPASYNDPYLKKIQLALYEIAENLKLRGVSLDVEITVAADYQIPKVLEGMNILKYSAELAEKINNQELIESGSKEEKALRAATILACDEISVTKEISIPMLDRILWLARNDVKKPFHLTKTPLY